MGDYIKHRTLQWLLSRNGFLIFLPLYMQVVRLHIHGWIQQTPPTATWLVLDWKSSASKGIYSQYFSGTENIKLWSNVLSIGASVLVCYRVMVKSNCTLFEQNMRQRLYRLLGNLLEHINTGGDTLYIRWVHIHTMKEEYVTWLQNVYNTTW